MNKFCIFALVFVSLYIVTDACRCGIIGDDAKICYNNFAVIGVVKKRRIRGSDYVYKVKIRRTLKGGYFNRKQTIYSTTMPSMCGVKLEINTMYLLSGSRHNNKLTLSLCHVARKMTTTQANSYRMPKC